MISFLNGKLVEKSPTHAIIEVGGVGFDINISLNTFKQLAEIGTVLFLHIYLHVREDQLSLFGFVEISEKNLFQKLISISGIGPKLAQVILSGATVEEFTESVLEENIPKLTRIPGIGKKTAQRLIFDLKDKLVAGESKQTDVEAKLRVADDIQAVNQEAILALVSLGYTQQAAETAVKKVRKKQPDFLSVEELIRCALVEV